MDAPFSGKMAVVTGASDGLGRGSRFTVRLPLLADAAEREAGAGDPQRGAAVTVHPRRILVVEDSQDVAESLSAWREDDGHQVRVARTGAEALAEASAFRPEVMLVDIGLPDMSGYDLARKNGVARARLASITTGSSR